MGNRDRTRAFLTEFIIVILFFSISAVITAQLFAAAKEKSREAKNCTNAGVAIVNVTEEILSNSSYSQVKDCSEYTKYFDKNWKETTKENSTYVLYAEFSFTDDVSSEENEDTVGRLYGKLLDGTIAVADNEKVIAKTKITKYFSK